MLVRGRFHIVVTCAVLAAVIILCIAPAYAIYPCALRAWNSAFALLFLLCTLIVYALAAPALAEAILAATRHDRPGGGDLLRLTCTLQI